MAAIGYHIKRTRYCLEKASRVEESLSKDGHWYFDAEPEFSSLVDAKSWFAQFGKHLPNPYGIRATYFIEGPNGGRHALKLRSVK